MVHISVNRYGIIISQVAQYVFEHCSEAITLDELSAYTGFSKYHFNGIFFAATGYPLGEYIQRKKLEKALYLIKQGNHHIIDVALSVGYDSASSFTRSFSKMFSVTPSDVVQGKLPINERGGVLPSKKFSDQNLLQPKWVELPEREIYGLSDKGFSEQCYSAVASTLYSRLIKLADPLHFSALQPVGVSIDNPWVGEQTESQFFAGFIHGLKGNSGVLEVFKWRAGRWACFTHTGPHSLMWQTISQIYAQWIIPQNIKLRDQQIVQRYLNNPKTTATDILQTELYFLVVDEL
jgi:AraC family transcriptional regulator